MLTTISLILGAATGVVGAGAYVFSAFTYDDPNPNIGAYLFRYTLWSIAPSGIIGSALTIITQNPTFLALNLIPVIGFGCATLIPTLLQKFQSQTNSNVTNVSDLNNPTP
jgi:hypothetical protein